VLTQREEGRRLRRAHAPPPERPGTGRCAGPARLPLPQPLLPQGTGCARPGPALPCPALLPAATGGSRRRGAARHCRGHGGREHVGAAFGLRPRRPHLPAPQHRLGHGGCRGRGGRGQGGGNIACWPAGGDSRRRSRRQPAAAMVEPAAGPPLSPTAGRAASRRRPTRTPLPRRAPQTPRASLRAVLEHGFAAYSLLAAPCCNGGCFPC